MGAAFGGSSTGTVFGGRGASTVLTKMTTGAAVLFMVLSIILARASADSSSVDGSIAAPDEAVAGAAPTVAGEEPAEEKKVEVPAADGTTVKEAAVAAPAAGTAGDAP
jgi:preprotein translocase subunit SecG